MCLFRMGAFASSFPLKKIIILQIEMKVEKVNNVVFLNKLRSVFVFRFRTTDFFTILPSLIFRRKVVLNYIIANYFKLFYNTTVFSFTNCKRIF